MTPRYGNRQSGYARNDNRGRVGVFVPPSVPASVGTGGISSHRQKISWGFLHPRRGQSIMETAILFMVVLFAFIAMMTYIKRSVQGRLRRDADSIGQQYDFERTGSNTTTTYSSHATTSSQTQEQAVVDPATGWSEDRQVTTVVTDTDYERSNTTGREVVGAP